PGGISSARPQRALIGIAPPGGAPSADQILLDVGSAVPAAARLPDPVRQERHRALHARGLLGIGERLQPDRETLALRRELDEELLGVAAIDHQRLHQRRAAAALAIEALDLHQEIALADDERLEALLVFLDRDAAFQH